MFVSFLLGPVLSALYEWAWSLYLPIVVHSVFNLIPWMAAGSTNAS